MVAYSFQARFEGPILTGRKTGTIRAIGRRRHARAGEQMQLYTAMRTRSCRLLARVECLTADPIRLCFASPAVVVGPGLIEECHAIDDLDAFAQGDGFRDWDDMAAYWRASDPLPRLGPWVGLWVRWRPETMAV